MKQSRYYYYYYYYLKEGIVIVHLSITFNNETYLHNTYGIYFFPLSFPILIRTG